MIVASAVVCAGAATSGFASQAAKSQDSPREHPGVIGVIEVPLANLWVSVYDRDGKVVDGLTMDAFHVYEDKAEQKIAVFNQQDQPIRIGLLVDSSGSMSSKYVPAKEAVKRFVQVSNPQDKFFGATFDDSVHPVASPQELMDLMFARGSTTMLDALYFGLVELEDTRNVRKALLIISDGEDNHSKHTRDEVMKLVREAGVPVYALGLSDARPEERAQMVAGQKFLRELCNLSGGRLVLVKQATELPDLAAEIGSELRKQYMLSYYPTNGMQGPHDLRWRKLEVKVEAKGIRGPLKIYAPEGYYYSATTH